MIGSCFNATYIEMRLIVIKVVISDFRHTQANYFYTHLNVMTYVNNKRVNFFFIVFSIIK